MHILVVPMYSKQELNADSNYVIFSTFIRKILHVHPDWHFVVIFPDKESGYVYEDDGFTKLPNVSILPQRISPRKMANAISYNAMWFDRLFRTFGFDAVWCHMPEIAGHLKVANQPTFDTKCRPAIIAQHHYVIHESLPVPIHTMENVLLAQISGALLADLNIFNSQHCQQMFIESAGRYLKPEVISNLIASRSRIIPHGVLSKYVHRERRNDIPVIGYNHRLQSYKDYKTTFKVLNDLWNDGVKFEVRYITCSRERTSEILKYPFVRLQMNTSFAEYQDQLADCDLNVTNSKHETFCISAIEAMSKGQCIVAPNGVTFPELVDKDVTKYPYLFDTEAQQKEMLIKLLTDKNEREKWGSILQESVMRRYGVDEWVKQFENVFETYYIDDFGTPDDALDLILQSARESNGLTVRELFTSVTTKRVNGRMPFGNQSLLLTKLIRLCRKIGLEVRFVKGEQRVFVH